MEVCSQAVRQREECKAIVSWSIKVGGIDFSPPELIHGNRARFSLC